MKILIGTFEIARHIHDFADGMRALGHEVDTLLYVRNPQHPDLEYTYELRQEDVSKLVTQLQRNPLGSMLANYEELGGIRHLLTAYDAYVFQFGCSILPGNQDFPILKSQGKKIISLFNGSDIQHWSTGEPLFEHYGYRFDLMYRSEPYSNLENHIRPLRMAERYADVIFSNPVQSGLAVRPYFQPNIPLNLSLYDHHIPERDVPVVVHAPTRRGFKGTKEILAVLEKLRTEGVEFELKLLEHVPNKTVVQELCRADVVLDQINSPIPAMFAFEGMATGCAVASGANYDFAPVPTDRPVWKIDNVDLYERVKSLLTQKETRVSLARRGRSYLEEYHDHVRASEHLLNGLQREQDGVFDYYPTFYARRFERPSGESISENVLRLTAEIIDRRGLPAGVCADELAARGLISVAARHTTSGSKDLASASRVWTWQIKPSAEEPWGYSPLLEGRPPVDPAWTVQINIERALGAVSRSDAVTAATAFRDALSMTMENRNLMENAGLLFGLARVAKALNQDELATRLIDTAVQGGNTGPDSVDSYVTGPKLEAA